MAHRRLQRSILYDFAAIARGFADLDFDHFHDKLSAKVLHRKRRPSIMFFEKMSFSRSRAARRTLGSAYRTGGSHKAQLHPATVIPLRFAAIAMDFCRFGLRSFQWQAFDRDSASKNNNNKKKKFDVLRLQQSWVWGTTQAVSLSYLNLSPSWQKFLRAHFLHVFANLLDESLWNSGCLDLESCHDSLVCMKRLLCDLRLLSELLVFP